MPYLYISAMHLYSSSVQTKKFKSVHLIFQNAAYQNRNPKKMRGTYNHERTPLRYPKRRNILNAVIISVSYF